MRIAIVILCGGFDSEGKGYDDLIESIRQTWAKNAPSNVDIYYNYGLIPNYSNNPKIGEVILDGDKIICGIEDTYDNMVPKVLQCFKFISNNLDYDYIFRCCCGSYVHIENLIKFLLNKPKKQFYCGIKTYFGDTPFASGSGFFLSKDLVNFINNNYDNILHNIVSLDDVTIGNYFYKNNISIHDRATRTDIGDLPFNKEEVLNLYCLKKNEYHYHMRHNLRGMHHLHSLFINKKYC